MIKDYIVISLIVIVFGYILSLFLWTGFFINFLIGFLCYLLYHVIFVNKRTKIDKDEKIIN